MFIRKDIDMRLEVLIGFPASGKSTYSKAQEKNGVVVFSSDAIRKELYGDEDIQGNAQDVFGLLNQRLVSLLSIGKQNAIVDATNMSIKARKKYIYLAKRYRYEVVAKWFTTPLDVCLERNSKRDRVVPKFVFERMKNNFQEPTLDEGFDKIEVV